MFFSWFYKIGNIKCILCLENIEEVYRVFMIVLRVFFKNMFLGVLDIFFCFVVVN